MSGASVVSSLGLMCCGLVVWRVSVAAPHSATAQGVRVRINRSVLRQDFCCETGRPCSLLAEGQTPLALPEDFDQRDARQPTADFISLASNGRYGVAKPDAAKRRTQTTSAHLLRLLTEHVGRKRSVPSWWCRRTALDASETEWQGWINNADDAVIEASTGKSMEAPTLRLVRNTLRAGANLNATGEHVMMPSASPKQRVLTGSQIWRNVPECLYSPEGLEQSAYWRRKRPFKRAGSCWHSLYPRRNNNQDADIAYCRRSTSPRNRYAAPDTLTRGVRHSGTSLHRMTPVPYKRLAQEQALYWVIRFIRNARGRTWPRRAAAASLPG